MTRLFGLLGYPLTHSFSQPYFTKKFQEERIEDTTYVVFEEEHIDDFVEKLPTYKHLVGFNITIPHKENIIPFLSELSEEASYVNAVNTVVYNEGKMIGYNTDVIGFRQSIEPLITDQHQQALILGTGGASKAVEFVLNQLEVPTKLVSRSGKGDLSYDQMTSDVLKDHQVIVNTTPLGTYPNNDTCPLLPYDAFTDNHLCYDLVYNPEVSKFLGQAKAKGAMIKNGLEMLHLQAEASWTIWNNKKATE